MADILGPANADNSVTTRPAESRGFGSVDTFFKDCTAPTAEDGTEFQASFFNGLIAALRVVSRINGKKIDAVTDIVTDDGADDNILAKALQNLIQRGQQAYAVGSGTANAIIATLSPVPSELKAGLVVRVKVGTSNTDVATINVNGSGAIAIKHPNGAGLVSGDLIAGGHDQAKHGVFGAVLAEILAGVEDQHHQHRVGPLQQARQRVVMQLLKARLEILGAWLAQQAMSLRLEVEPSPLLAQFGLGLPVLPHVGLRLDDVAQVGTLVHHLVHLVSQSALIRHRFTRHHPGPAGNDVLHQWRVLQLLSGGNQQLAGGVAH